MKKSLRQSYAYVFYLTVLTGNSQFDGRKRAFWAMQIKKRLPKIKFGQALLESDNQQFKPC